ncbi:MAG: hypothetical protein NWE95_13765 [Candidatus Bathyarchaeota archaeon]|nr:hypothetical protein [Candidatus Bathyarchaeota archaeon]
MALINDIAQLLVMICLGVFISAIIVWIPIMFVTGLYRLRIYTEDD